MYSPIRLDSPISGKGIDSVAEKLLAGEQKVIDTWNKFIEQIKNYAHLLRDLASDIATKLFPLKAVTSTATSVAIGSATAAATSGAYDITVCNIATAHVIYGTQQATGWTCGTTGNVILNGATIAIASGDTLTDIATKINAATYATGEELLAMVIDNQLTIQTVNTGADQSVHGAVAGTSRFAVVTDDANNILNAELGLIDRTGAIMNEAQAATDAFLSVNGVPVSSSSNTVTEVPYLTISIVDAGRVMLNVGKEKAQAKTVTYVALAALALVATALCAYCLAVDS